MMCAYHQEVESVTLCHACGKAICAQCQHDVRGANYCPECLAQAIEKPPLPAPPPKTPGLAAFLAFVPGLGAIYNGQYIKAATFIAVFAGLIHFIDSARGSEEVLAGLSIAAFYFYMIFDAYRSAIAINASPASREPVTAVAKGERESLVWGIVITGIGVLFQLRNFDLFSLNWIFRLWPLAIIIPGVKMLTDYFSSSRREKSEGSENV